jgi:hypothetical protein
MLIKYERNVFSGALSRSIAALRHGVVILRKKQFFHIPPKWKGRSQ